MNENKKTFFEYEQRLKKNLKESNTDAVERHALIAIIDGDDAEFSRLTTIMKKRKKIVNTLRIVK